MLICKVTMSYDRGIAGNTAPDLGLEAEPEIERADGKILRGLGTHYESAEAAALAKERGKEDIRIRAALRSRFVFSPIPGTYIISRRGEAKDFLAGIDPPIRSDVRAIAHEYDLTTPAEMAADELAEWGGRLQAQLRKVSLGATPEADAEGLACLEALAACPVMPAETSLRLRELVAAGRSGSMGRIKIKRALSLLEIPLADDVLVSPRGPALLADDPAMPAEVLAPRRPAPILDVAVSELMASPA